MYLTAEFPGTQSVASAIRALKASGSGSRDLDVFSTEPVEFEPGVLDRPSRMSLTAVCGALTFGLLATGFVWFTQHNYPPVTGGMPTFSFWATGVVSYELTISGAIVTTFACFLWESGLLRQRGAKAPVPAHEPGVISLRVRVNQDQLAAAGDSLRRAGAKSVTRLSES
ncbi:MAG: quinol:electron acceptor oxidoreductase subunit ActD [Bryobacteraceae bacterium]